MGFLLKAWISFAIAFMLTVVIVWADERVPIDVQSFIEGGKYYIVKTYLLPDETSCEDLSGKSFEQNGVIYNQTNIEQKPIEDIEKKIAEVVEQVTIGSQNNAAVLSKLPAQKEYADEEGFVGILQPVSTEISYAVNGYTTKTYTAKDSRYYYNLPSRDTSNISKSIVSNGISMNITDIQWIDSNNAESGDTAVGSNFTAQAFYSGSYTKKLPSGYTATVPFRGEVTRSIVQNVEFKITYQGEKIVKPVSTDTVRQDKKHILRGFTIAAGIFAGTFVCILIYLAVHYMMSKNREE